MRKVYLMIAVLMLSACVPEPLYPTPFPPLPTSPENILPVEAQRIIDAATATAGAVATDSALATATEESARATSTTGARETADSLVVLQTQSALQLTAGAGQALATNAAAVHTADADQTAAAATPTAAALRVLVAATGTELARQAQTDVRRQEIDDQVAAAWRWALLFVGAAFLLGLAVALVFGISDLLSARAALVQAQAAKAQAEAMQMWIMQYGGVLLQLHAGQWEPLRVETPQLPAAPSEPVVTNVREVPVRAHGEVVSSIPVGEPETPERARVAHLLMQAIAIAGPNAGFVPGADRMGMHPQEWARALESLKAGPDRMAYVMTSAGRPKAGQVGRTRLCQPAYMTLGALLDGLKRGDVLPPPPPATSEPAA